MIDAFKIGVHLGFSTNGLGLLGLLRGELGRLHGAAKKAEEGFSALKLAAIGATTIVGGAAGLKVLWHMVEAAKELNHELVKVKIGAALSDDQVAGVRTDAYRMTKEVPGTRVEDAVKVQRELFGTFGDMKEVHDTLKSVLQANVALSRYGDTKTDVAQVAIRALEMRGHITKDGKVDPTEFNKELDALTRSIIASEGLLKPNDYLQAIRQAGPAATSMDANAFWGMMPAAMIAMGSQKAGTALASLYTQVIGHVVAGKRIAVAMEGAGMLKPGSWRVERGGHVVMDQNAVVNQSQFARDPFTWLHGMLEGMAGKKDRDGKPIDAIGIVQEIFQLSSRITSARLINDVRTNWPIFQNEQNRANRAPNAETALNMQNNEDLGANIVNLQVAWKNFMTALGEPGIPLAIDILHRLTTTVTDMSLWASQNGDTVLVLAKVAGGLSLLAIALGTLAVGAAAGAALLMLTGPVGLVALGSGLVAVASAVPSLEGAIQRLLKLLTFNPFGYRNTPAQDQYYQDHPITQGPPVGIFGNRPDGSPKSMFPPNKPIEGGGTPPGYFMNQSFVPPPNQDMKPQNIRAEGNLMLQDGTNLGRYVMQAAARSISGPARGTTGFDIRAGFGGTMPA